MTSAVGLSRQVSVGQPAWFANAAEKEWINPRLASGQGTDTQLRAVTAREIGIITWNSNQVPHNYPEDIYLIGVWCGAMAGPDHYMLMAEGGHARTSDNGVYVFGPFSSNTPGWHRVHNADDSISNPGSNAYYTTGRPASRHGYHDVVYIPDLGGGNGNYGLSYECGAPYPGGGSPGTFTTTYQFPNPPHTATTSLVAGEGAGSWTPEGGDPAFPGGNKGGLFEQGVIDWDTAEEVAWVFNGPTAFGSLWAWNPIPRTWTSYPVSPAFNGSQQCKCGAIDPVRRIALGLPDSGAGTIVVMDISTAHRGDWFNINATGNPEHPNGTTGGRPGLAFEPVGGKFVCWDGGQILWTIEPPDGFRSGTNDPANPITMTDPADWVWTQVTGITGVPIADTGSTGTGLVTSGIYGKFRYISSIGALCTQAIVEEDMYVFKVPAAGL